MDLSGFLERLYELLRHDEIRKGLFVVLPISWLIGFWIGRYFPTRSLMPVEPPRVRPSPLASCQKCESALRAVSEDGPGLWLATAPKRPANYPVIKSSIPIYTISNLKGGVGKTTLASGLASFFVNPFAEPDRNRERVLLIDLDFQGSLSSMALTLADRIPHDRGRSRSTLLISGEYSGANLVREHQRVKGLDPFNQVEFYCLPAYYDLAQAENRLLVRWLLGEEARDIRYNLAEVLFSDEVQSRYDRIIIDAPPRLTIAHVQALAASTHVIIPTVLDQLSGEAVGGFVEQAIIHRDLWPHLKILGVVGSMTEQDQGLPLKDYEKRGIVSIQEAMKQIKDSYGLNRLPTEIVDREAFVPDLISLGRAAGMRIGYLENSDGVAAVKIRRVFSNLGKEVLRRHAEAVALKDLVGS